MYTADQFPGLILDFPRSQVVMTFSHPEGHVRFVTLPRRSILVMTGDSRYLWTHGIVPRKTDVIHNPDNGLTLSYRETRVSFTFRRLRRAPCVCGKLIDFIGSLVWLAIDDIVRACLNKNTKFGKKLTELSSL